MNKKGQTPPFETRELRRKLTAFLDREVVDPVWGPIKLGNYKFGVYAFFDYDKEPIYVGQTNEKLRTRIRRHLTNQRTDAVAMNVLDPFEVHTVEVWPLPQFQDRATEDKEAKAYLNALELHIYNKLVAESHFGAILNEKEPLKTELEIESPASHQGVIVSAEVVELRGHPDVRIARRALVLSRLAQVISERQVQTGLRTTLLTQAKRLAGLAESRLADFPGGNGGEDDEGV